MSSVNKVILIGRLGREPEIKAFQNGDKIANLALATSERWRDKQGGEMREKTEWHRVTLHDRLAEIAQQYLHKGDNIYIEGKLQTRKFKDSNGTERSITEIHSWSGLQMLGGKSGGGAAPAAPAAPPPAAPATNQGGNGFEGMDDDIPF